MAYFPVRLPVEYGDICKKHKSGEWVIIPICGTVRIADKGNVLDMSKGLAKWASQKFFKIKPILGKHILENGYVPCVLPEYRMIFYPIKFNKQDKASEVLIKTNYLAILKLMEQHGIERIYSYELSYKDFRGGAGRKFVYDTLKKYWVKDKIIFMENLGEKNA